MTAVQYTTLALILVAFLIAAVVMRAIRVIVDRALNALEIVSTENRAAVHARAQQLLRAVTLLAYGIAAAASVSLAMSRFGIHEPRWSLRAVAYWSADHGFNIAIILVGAYVVIRAANLAIEHLQYKLGRRHASTDLEWQRRAATLGGILTSLVSATVGFIAALMLLRELAIDVVPILTGAGIAGLAVG